MYTYSGKTFVITNYTIAVSNTWELAQSEIGAVRRWMIQARRETFNNFDLAFTSNPTAYLTTVGTGWSFDNCALLPVYVRGNAGTIIEILYIG